jgi:DNA-binding Lrp family transcriptional regulator
MPRWGFLTNHGLVLIRVTNHPRSTLREISDEVGITERAALSILRSLEDEGIITRQKEGRRNRYWVDFDALIKHEVPGPYNIGEIATGLMAIADRINSPVEVAGLPTAAATPSGASAGAPSLGL